VQGNAKQKIGILVLCAALPWIPPALAAESSESDGSTVTVAVPVKTGLDLYRDATELSDHNLKDLLSQVGFEGQALRIAWAVAKKESNGRPKAHNGDTSTGDNSYGIFQINMLGSLGEARREKFNLESDKDLFDPVKNAQIAYHMTNGGKDWSSWKVYPGQRNGERYEDFLQKFPQK
jgi:hypothetical protein